MKIKMILIILICLGITLNSAGQDKPFTQEEYDAALKGSYSKESKIARRITNAEKRYSKGKITETVTIVRENIPPDESRWLTISEKENGISTRYEDITIGDIIYTRNNQEAWTRANRNNGSGNGFRIDRATGEILKTVDCREFMRIPTDLDNQKVILYLSYRVSTIQGFLLFIEDRHWINADGLTVKSTTKVSRVLPEIVSSFSTTTYEYNPKDLKIEAPIVK